MIRTLFKQKYVNCQQRMPLNLKEIIMVCWHSVTGLALWCYDLHSCTWRFRLSTDPKIPTAFSLAVVLTTYFGLSQKCKKILSSVIAEAPAPYVHVFAPIIHYSRLIVSTRLDLCIVNRLLSFSSQYRKPIPPHFIVSWMISVIIFVPHNRNPLSIPFYKPKIIYKASERFLKIYLSYKL